MTNTHRSNELTEALGVENIPHHTVRLALEEPALWPASDDSTGVLAVAGGSKKST